MKDVCTVRTSTFASPPELLVFARQICLVPNVLGCDLNPDHLLSLGRCIQCLSASGEQVIPNHSVGLSNNSSDEKEAAMKTNWQTGHLRLSGAIPDEARQPLKWRKGSTRRIKLPACLKRKQAQTTLYQCPALGEAYASRQSASFVCARNLQKYEILVVGIFSASRSAKFKTSLELCSVEASGRALKDETISRVKPYL